MLRTTTLKRAELALFGLSGESLKAPWTGQIELPEH